MYTHTHIRIETYIYIHTNVWNLSRISRRASVALPHAILCGCCTLSRAQHGRGRLLEPVRRVLGCRKVATLFCARVCRPCSMSPVSRACVRLRARAHTRARVGNVLTTAW